MAWQTDQPPLEYLKRRIIYYKKKRGSIKGMAKDSDFMYTDDEINFVIKRIGSRIKEFEDAVSILSVEKLKRMRTNK